MRSIVVRLVLAVAVFGAYAVLARFVLHGPVDRKTLAVSVTLRSGSVGPLVDKWGACARRTRSTWRCTVVDTGDSGGATYRIDVRSGSSCWRGRLARDFSEAGMPREIAGCVHRWQWSLLSALE